ncbi:hypothetical protein [Paraburkholderia sp. J41]|uniref:hypothetical protein n=1 Tax=Paraburkholderia sp. J41 TaxID=2805433 RepID=UPI002AC36065|nr:hypothetical protein [Paraburkholderia sp. J41]
MNISILGTLMPTRGFRLGLGTGNPFHSLGGHLTLWFQQAQADFAAAQNLVVAGGFKYLSPACG